MTTTGDDAAGPPLPAELITALDETDGAWDGWQAADQRTRTLFAEWVAKPRTARLRRERAAITAEHAAHGVLRHAIERPGLAEAGVEAGVETGVEAGVSAAAPGVSRWLIHTLGNMIN
ncbi:MULTISPECIES: YdeI/OmpD-associated family protein [Frankia]|uniref:YdeI/OmpD-associated family protein n=1 Tax=Frankia TaxID=1854 RepID=UPI00200E254B|nr:MULTISPECIES: YdeI/OmpD-associated family protein [Frankia]